MTTALIFGAAGGLGRAIASVLTRADVRVLGVCRDERAAGGVEAFSADLSEEREVAEACLWAAREAGSIDLLIFAAGRIAKTPLAETSAEALQRLFADNVTSAHLMLRHAAPLCGVDTHRFFLGAYVDKLLFPRLGAYAAAKAALDAWVRVLIREERTSRTTLLRLPAVDTPLWAQAPFPLPRGALSAERVAEEVLRCWREQATGVVDVA